MHSMMSAHSRTHALMAGIVAFAAAMLASAGDVRSETLAASYYHTCSIVGGGGIKCWGRNPFRQLGDGTTIDHATPVDATVLTSPATAVATGTNHTCAITPAGGVKCWGANRYGQLGNGNTVDSAEPVDVVGLNSGVVAITAAHRHTCVVTTSGAMKCWGGNEHGQLGNGSTTGSSLPVDVSGLSSGVLAIASGWFNTCAVTTAGAAKCWGDNSFGQLGDGSVSRATAPVDVSGLASGVTAIAIHMMHACALLDGGGMKCWGENYAGQLGNGSTDSSPVPVDVLSLGAPVSGMAVDRDSTCALTRSGAVRCWGVNDLGQLGDGTYLNHSLPNDVAGLGSGVVAIAMGTSHACARLESGELRCWGGNYGEELGNGVPSRRATPVDVLGIDEGSSAIAVGWSYACATTSAGEVKCWGDNRFGELGDDTYTSHIVPAAVLGLGEGAGAGAISAGISHTCARKAGGAAVCWGAGDSGQVGTGFDGSFPYAAPVSGLSTGTARIAAGANHSCAVTDAGGVKCWGQNNAGQLGDGTTDSHPAPVDVVGLASGISSVAAGYDHTCAITTLGSVKCWGLNDGGQLGDGTTDWQLTPVDVVGLDAIAVAIAAGNGGTCVVTDAGVVKCWGWGSAVPAVVAGLESNTVAVSIGDRHTCALSRTGGLKCWGYNAEGQLGDGTLEDRATPVDVVGLTSGVIAVSTALYDTCAVTEAGRAKCWGSNSSGQLGNGEAGYVLSPRTVVGSPFGDVLFRSGFEGRSAP